jgi:hypothetical protein
LNGNIECGNIECFEKNLSHLFSVGFGILRSLSQKCGVLFGGDSQFVEEGMMPDSFHIVPVVDDTVFNRVL